MNTFSPDNQITFAFIRKVLFALIFCMSAIYTVRAGTNNTDKMTRFKDSIVITTNLSIRSHKARLYPDITNENLLFAATGKKGKVYQLFVFDMDGKLVMQTRILEKQTEQLTGIKKGNYLFEVFNDDLRIENGSIVIK